MSPWARSLVLLPADAVRAATGVVPPNLAQLATRVVAAVESAGRELDRDARRTGRYFRLLDAAAAAARELAGALAPRTAAKRRAARALVPSAYDAYLGVRRLDLSEVEIAAEVTAVARASLEDLRLVWLDAPSIAAELRAIARMLERIAGGPAGADLPEARGALAAARRRPSRSDHRQGLRRWILGHHLYGVFNLYAAHDLEAAAAEIARGALGRASGLLGEAVLFVRGFTAAMAHAGGVSADYYGRVVRPTMSPPRFPVELSGAMNPEHARYRRSIEGLLAAVPEEFPRLVRRHMGLALARATLLEADLLDIERHVGLAASLVGEERALTQAERSPDNAVTLLRRMASERQCRYAPLLRYGARAAALPRERVRL